MTVSPTDYDLREAWFRANNTLYWSDDWFISTPTFHAVNPGSFNPNGWFGVTRDGLTLFTYRLVSGAAFISATPKTPSLTRLIGLGDVTPFGGTISQFLDFQVIKDALWIRVLVNTTPSTLAFARYGEGLWSWYGKVPNEGPNEIWYGRCALSPLSSPAFTIYYDPTNREDLSLLGGVIRTGGSAKSNIFFSDIGVGYVVRSNVPADAQSGYDYVHRIDASADIYGAALSPFNGNGYANLWKVRTSYGGVHCYAVDKDGVVYVSEDGLIMVPIGSTLQRFSEIADGWEAGGGLLCAIKNSVASLETGVFQLSINRGVGFVPADGNFWDLTSGVQTIDHLHLVNPTPDEGLPGDIQVYDDVTNTSSDAISVYDNPIEVSSEAVSVDGVAYG